jgi:hypothetical protein
MAIFIGSKNNLGRVSVCGDAYGGFVLNLKRTRPFFFVAYRYKYR